MKGRSGSSEASTGRMRPTSDGKVALLFFCTGVPKVSLLLMDFGTLAAAAVGAVIGVGSTLITDFVRAHRDLDQKWTDTKRLVYVRFLEALAQAHSRIIVTAMQDLSGAEKRQAIHHAFHNDPQYSEAKSVLRELAITAPDHVYRLACDVYERLRIVRDVLAQPSATVDYPEFKQANGPFFRELEVLQDVMRDDLQSARRRHHKTLLKRQADVRSEPSPPLTEVINSDQNQELRPDLHLLPSVLDRWRAVLLVGAAGFEPVTLACKRKTTRW